MSARFLKKNSLFDRNFKTYVGSTLSNQEDGIHNQEEGIPQRSFCVSIPISIKINSFIKYLNPGINSSLYFDDFICKWFHDIQMNKNFYDTQISKKLNPSRKDS